ncbi:hypothetical protein G205_12917 [Arthrobacter nitrophenolicus]|uniref:Uncharacterized protein n=1 Tax=Arthrobacter nitrophenolicus TaxID=683150 RepID=L8TRJ2_9MICC|nr:hypothetical protein G205_12917 [Arthrobacter nitrophenolicus]
MNVVAAGVGDAVVLRRERQARFLDDGQGVDVTAQGGCDGAFADVHRKPGALKAAGFQAGLLEPFGQFVRGPVLLEGEFGVRVQVPAEFDQFRQERLEPGRHQGGGLGFSSVITHFITLARMDAIQAITVTALHPGQP